MERSMDCCICANARWLTICQDCYEASVKLKTFANNLEAKKGDAAPKPPLKSLAEMLKWMEGRGEVEGELTERLRFVGLSSAAFTDGIHTDIMVKPAGNGPAIPAHKALLATKSEILRTLLSSDECKAPAADSISFPELTHQQLYSLLHFLYTGALPSDHDVGTNDVYALLLAADKYDIPFLRSFCERQVLLSLSPANALDVLELSEACCNSVLRENAMSVITTHVDDIIFSNAYETFAAKNAHLCVEITRMLLKGRGKR